MIQGMKMERLQKNIQVLLDTGFSFEGLFKNRSNDFELITDVNAAIRKTLESGGVDPEVVEASMEASLDAFATWGYGPLTEADI
jgi:hypothetical protein